MPKQLAFSWETRAALGREDFIAGAGNEAAVAFIDSWPNWHVTAAVLHGPSGSGKSHLAAIWCAKADARTVTELGQTFEGPLLIEDVDALPPTEARDRALFAILEHAAEKSPVLLTGKEPPAAWPTVLPDLASRFAALVHFSLWAPDDALLAGIARKLFTDRQLAVPDAVIMRIVTSLERSPAAIRDFVARADASALAGARPVNVALIRELLDEDMSPP
jgi:chromosomal replication initiation ATPase DnaA